MIPDSWKVYLDIGGAICFAILVFLVVHHLETVGENRVKAQDAAAVAADHAKMLEQQTQMQAQADKAEAQRDATQKQLDDFRTANPVGHVFVCHPGDPKPGLPGATGSLASAPGTGAGSAAIPEMPAGSTDIGSPLDAIVHAAGNLGALYRQSQEVMQVDRGQENPR